MDAETVSRTLQGGDGMKTGSIILNVLSILAIGWYVTGAILFLPIGQWIKWIRNRLMRMWRRMR